MAEVVVDIYVDIVVVPPNASISSPPVVIPIAIACGKCRGTVETHIASADIDFIDMDVVSVAAVVDVEAIAIIVTFADVDAIWAITITKVGPVTITKVRAVTTTQIRTVRLVIAGTIWIGHHARQGRRAIVDRTIGEWAIVVARTIEVRFAIRLGQAGPVVRPIEVRFAIRFGQAGLVVRAIEIRFVVRPGGRSLNCRALGRSLNGVYVWTGHRFGIHSVGGSG